MEAGERTLEIVKYSDRILEALEVTDAGSDDAREDMALGPEESVHVDLLSVAWCGCGVVWHYTELFRTLKAISRLEWMDWIYFRPLLIQEHFAVLINIIQIQRRM